jgi:hypothetical protein
MEIACILPDRCIKVRRMDSPFGPDIVETFGFNGDVQIRRRVSDIPYPPDPFANESSAQKAERARRATVNMRHELTRLLVPLIGLPLDPIGVTYQGQRELDGKSANVLGLEAADGYEARLFVDAATHLPAMVSWMGIPDIVFATESIATVRGGEVVRSTAPSSPPPGDPAAGRPKVERRIYYSDFKTEGGLTLPRRFKEVVDGRVVLDTRVAAYKINPKLDLDRFDPAK